MKNRSAPNHGFALVIALSLMAFILLLILSITTLVRVETESANIQLAQLEARMNAQLGAMIALGDLQRYTGPDQRVTGTGELIDTTVDSKKQHTVVWDATAAAGENPISWLVSKSQQAPFNEAEATNSEWPILVSQRTSSGGILAEAVSAEPLPITGKNNANAGEYAWWVGDEGVKAKLTLVEDENLINSTTEADEKKRLRLAARSGIELIDEFKDKYPYEAEESSGKFRGNLSKLVNLEQTKLVEIGDAADTHFHNVTVHSKSVLTDVEHGGLKDDLTFLLSSNGRKEGSIFDELEYDQEELDKYPDLDIPSAYDRVTWEQLKSFSEVGNELSALGEGSFIEARAQTKTDYGIAPILSMMNLNFGVTFSSNYDGDPAQTAADRQYYMRHHIRPWFVLANPYNVPLKASNYRVRLQTQWTKVQVFTDEKVVSQRQQVGPAFIPKDIYEHMVFTVPVVELPPGEARIYSLSYDDWSEYEYSFDQSNNTTELACDLKWGNATLGFNNSEEPQQFVFEEGYDNGYASIVLAPKTFTPPVSGQVLEFEKYGIDRIKPLGWHFVTGANGSTTMGWSGNVHVRTYLGDGNEVLETDKLVQYFGKLNGSNNNLSSHLLGFWKINELPDVINPEKSYARYSNPRVYQDDVGVLANWMIGGSSAASLAIVLSGATNQNGYSTNSKGYTTNAGWLTDFNIRASRITQQLVGYKPAMGNYNAEYKKEGAGFHRNVIDDNIKASVDGFPWGAGLDTKWNDSPEDNELTREVILFDLPNDSNQKGLYSLGQLQHFNLGGYLDNQAFYELSDDEFNSDSLTAGGELAYGPTFAIGNSYSSPFIGKIKVFASSGNFDLLDTSYLMNDIFYDHYFFSAIPSSGDLTDMVNPRLKKWVPDSEDTFESTGSNSVSESFYVDGGFNVNSTSVDAWLAFLASFKGLEYGDESSGFGIFPRSMNQAGGSVDSTWNAESNLEYLWAGWRHIEEEPLRDLAEAIVEQVKSRGPFRSFAAFVNRQLTDDEKGLSGTIQAALDKTQNFEYYLMQGGILSNYSILANDAGTLYDFVDPDSIGSGEILNKNGTDTPASGVAGIPGWIMQGDLLQAIGPASSVRSDTFIIRSYGSANSLISGEKSSESYYELVVQRTPEFVDKDTDLADASIANLVSLTNQNFGRRYKIIDQRYITSSEL
ncbi:hypothetical protein N9R65_02175 [Opitutales bacterium]|nr:hypothetical protein [Opitutales bacterium]